MAQLVPYDVVYRTSEDEEFPIMELGDGHVQLHVPSSPSAAAAATADGVSASAPPIRKGWQSARNAKMPQVIVLRLPGRVELTQLRILSHEYKIASSVEMLLFALSGAEMEAKPPSFRSIRFMKLGAVNFNNNEHSNYRSKERKTIHLEAEAYYVKLLFNAPHHNAKNKFNQVGVYSIEITGRIISRVKHHADLALVKGDFTPLSQEEAQTPVKSPQIYREGPSSQHPYQQQKVSSSPPLTSAGDAISHDTDIPPFRSVRILEFEDFFVRRSEELFALKKQAVAIEDFELAKQCRDRINFMNRHSKRIYQLEQDKVQAIIDEDFDAAKQAKLAMDALIGKVYQGATLPQIQKPVNADEDHIGDTLPEDMPEGRNCNGDRRGIAENGRSNSIGGDSSSSSTTSSDDSAHGGDKDIIRLGGQKKKNGAEKDTGDDSKNKVLALPMMSKYVQHMTELVRDRTIEINEVVGYPTPKARATSTSLTEVKREEEDASSNNTSVLDTSTLPQWERTVADFIMTFSGELEWPSSLGDGVRNSREAMDLASSVGRFTTACLFSKRFRLREIALEALMDQMTRLYPAAPVVIEGAVLRFFDMNGYGLQDAIPSVIAAACAFTRMVLADEHKCLPAVLGPLMNLLPRLLCCAADSHPRIRNEARRTLTLCVKTEAIPNATILLAVLADPVDKERRRRLSSNASNSSPRVQVARLALFEELITSGRTGLRSYEEELWTKLLIPCLNHHSREVRDPAMALTTSLLKERKVVLMMRRVASIDNVAIREELKGISAATKGAKLPPPTPPRTSSTTSVAAASRVASSTGYRRVPTR